MMSSTEGTASQRVPAWKRLGLKLKGPTAAPEPAPGGTPAVGHPSSTQLKSHSNKRKLDAPPGPEPSLDIKKPRKEASDGNAEPKKKSKSVSFGDTPTKNGNLPTTAGDVSKQPVKQKQPPQPNKTKGSAKKQKHAPAVDLAPALQYLQQWKTSRDSWKFNKNHQSTLIKHAFDSDGIPAADIGAFYEYIRDLKGFVRTRLREAAMEIRAKDAAERASAFPAGTSDLEAKQISYEKLLNDLMQTSQGGQKRKGFNEVEYIASAEDPDVLIRRVVKRMRAQMIIDELSDGEQTDDSRTTQSSQTIATSDTNTARGSGTEKKLRLNDGSGKRRRKLRVNMDDSSSSESDSDSDSDTSSESSSDESDDEDEDDGDAKSVEGYDSSSSSSSSSSEGEDESESDSNDEESDDE
ncbi:proteasome subunit alpha type 6 [Purpureocillium lavendulum]|uniref:Proteasome subunit alpha type 6 n=1 Tax=Purpureocillium lavendulum TaxID=1247861 RepID=A0AB34FNF7_9HYPO|nr:proteasome subunit alpha type 6 [Purpureocillium lavendulum]